MDDISLTTLSPEISLMIPLHFLTLAVLEVLISCGKCVSSLDLFGPAFASVLILTTSAHDWQKAVGFD